MNGLVFSIELYPANKKWGICISFAEHENILSLPFGLMPVMGSTLLDQQVGGAFCPLFMTIYKW
jgi:hypothetical protein